MQIVDVSQFENGFVIHFATESKQINAYTLASTLVGLADAAKAANSSVNPGYAIEIVVEALGPGSFRAKIAAVYNTARNLFSNQVLQSIVLAILSNYVYERTLSVQHDVKVEIKTDEVVIEQGPNRIVVPRQVYDATRVAEKNPQFQEAMGRTLASISSDDKISAIAFVSDMNSPTPEVLIPRETWPETASKIEEIGNERLIVEECDLQIVKAILERSRRKWEFRWRGVRISASVVDQGFYTDFFAHQITIAPGDELKVRLQIKQTRDEETGIFTNVGYEVVKVIKHQPRMQQNRLPVSNGE